MQDDVIYRQAAIDVLSQYPFEKVINCLSILEELPSAEPELNEWCTDCKEYDHERHCCPMWNRVIRQTLKDVERKPGRWLMHSDFPDRLICSECGAQFDVWHWESEQMHFCPNCGAKMVNE